MRFYGVEEEYIKIDLALILAWIFLLVLLYLFVLPVVAPVRVNRDVTR